MFRIVFVMIVMLFFTDSMCQEIVVVKMVQSNSVQASTRRRDDIKGMPCALLKVQFPIENTLFYGNIVGEIDFKTNEYWVYMPEGTKEIKIVQNNFPPKTIIFSDYDIESLKSKYTYELTLLGKRTDAPNVYNEGMIAWAENDIVKAYDCLTQAAKEGYLYAYNSLSKMFTLSDDKGDSFYNEMNQLSKQYRQKTPFPDSSLNKSYEENVNKTSIKKEFLKKALDFEQVCNYDSAIYWYQRGDEMDDHISQYRLGRLYYEGIGIKKNYQKAKNLFEKSSCSLNDYRRILECHGFDGHYIYSTMGASEEAKCRSKAMASLACMYIRGNSVPINQKAANIYSYLSGSGYGKNVLGLYHYYIKKNYKLARNLLNIDDVPKDCIVDSILMGDVYYLLGMFNYSDRTTGGASLGKYYLKKSAKYGDSRAKEIVDHTFIGNILPDGRIISSNYMFNEKETFNVIGEIRNDGVILYYADAKKVGGRIDTQGILWNRDNTKVGYVNEKGNVYDYNDEKVGIIDEKGNAISVEGDYLGNLNGLPLQLGLLYFFFDRIATVTFLQYIPEHIKMYNEYKMR